MKILVVMLVLAVATGSQAFVLQNDSYPELEKLKEELQEYLANVTCTVNEKIDFIVKLQISRSLVDGLREGYARVKGRVDSLKTELPAEVSRAYEEAVGASMAVVEKGLHTLRGLKEKVSPATGRLAASLYDSVVSYTKAVLRKVDSYTGAMRRAVTEAAGKLKNHKLAEKLQEQLEELGRQLAPYGRRLRSRLEQLQASLEPYAGQTQAKVQQGMKKVEETFQPWISSILQALRKYTEDFKKWVRGSPAPPQEQ